MDIQEPLARLDQHRGSFPKDLVAEASRGGRKESPDSLRFSRTSTRTPKGGWRMPDG